jgi:hypothetical protein
VGISKKFIEIQELLYVGVVKLKERGILLKLIELKDCFDMRTLKIHI